MARKLMMNMLRCDVKLSCLVISRWTDLSETYLCMDSLQELELEVGSGMTQCKKGKVMFKTPIKTRNRETHLNKVKLRMLKP